MNMKVMWLLREAVVFAPIINCLLLLAGLAALEADMIPEQYREVFGYYFIVLFFGILAGVATVAFFEWCSPDEDSEEEHGLAYVLGVFLFVGFATVNFFGARLEREVSPVRTTYSDGNVYVFTTWWEADLGRWVAYQRNETTGKEILGLMPKTILALYAESNEVSFDPRTDQSCGAVKSKSRGRLQRCLEGEWWRRLPRPQRGDEFFFPNAAAWMRAKGWERFASASRL